MKIKKLYINLIFILCICQSQAFAVQTLTETIVTNVPGVVRITPTSTSTTGTINPLNGVNTGISSQFSILTNGTDSNYDYILTGTLQIQGAQTANAYFQKNAINYLILGNNAPNLLPTLASVNNIKTTPSQNNNPNAIAYPITNTLTNFTTITYANDPLYGGACFKVKTGATHNGVVKETVGTAPLAGTYYYGEDKPGTYEAVVQLTAYRRP